ncbi:MAG: hypothetical protein F4X44_13505 [Gammaproteobacteria bacterium]|nr:hypothetical protein [Gammaproteobacteria bacterium]MYD81614.1 hypothetical protein [Gammaproteobacteria bacterium]
MKQPSEFPIMSSPSITELVPMMICKDVQATIEFYREILGFEVRDRMDNVGTSGWASLERGPVRLMLASPSYIPAPKPMQGQLSEVLFYFYTDDVVGLRDHIVQRDYPVGDFAVRFYQMKEIELTDPEGHVLIFGQDTDEPPTPE